MSQNISTAVMQRRHEADDSLDDFPTPPWATRALCEYLRQGSDIAQKRAWEPACGAGHMARPLSEYFERVFASDVHGYGYGQAQDFLWPYEGPAFDWIITNPPFRLGEQFALIAIERAAEGVALFVRLAFLEGMGRYRNLFSKLKPTAILQFTERVPIHKGQLTATGSTATAYCWIVWTCKPHRPCGIGVPAFVWIPPCRRQLERPGDYAEAAV